MTKKSPSVYLVQKSQETTKLYLGGFSTFQGLALFEKSKELSVTSAFFEKELDKNGVLQKSLLSAKTVGEAASILEPYGPFDFSCEIQEDIQLSSHDDGECHISVPSDTIAKELILIAAPNDIASAIWNRVSENPNCYISQAEGSNEFSVFQNFNDYLDANS